MKRKNWTRTRDRQRGIGKIGENVVREGKGHIREKTDIIILDTLTLNDGNATNSDEYMKKARLSNREERYGREREQKELGENRDRTN